jgi:hypothetical protein
LGINTGVNVRLIRLSHGFFGLVDHGEMLRWGNVVAGIGLGVGLTHGTFGVGHQYIQNGPIIRLQSPATATTTILIPQSLLPLLLSLQQSVEHTLFFHKQFPLGPHPSPTNIDGIIEILFLHVIERGWHGREHFWIQLRQERFTRGRVAAEDVFVSRCYNNPT